MSAPVLTTNLPGFPRHQGKVRDIYDLGDHLLLVASDRISAFDVVMNEPIPDKGRILTALSAFWFRHLGDIVPNHLVSLQVEDFPAALHPYKEMLAGRTMLVRQCRPLPVECIVRGYLSGSGWAEYQKTGAIGGLPLPAGLVESQKLPAPALHPLHQGRVGDPRRKYLRGPNGRRRGRGTGRQGGSGSAWPCTARRRSGPNPGASSSPTPSSSSAWPTASCCSSMKS